MSRIRVALVFYSGFSQVAGCKSWMVPRLAGFSCAESLNPVREFSNFNWLVRHFRLISSNREPCLVPASSQTPELDSRSVPAPRGGFPIINPVFETALAILEDCRQLSTSMMPRNSLTAVEDRDSVSIPNIPRYLTRGAAVLSTYMLKRRVQSSTLSDHLRRKLPDAVEI
jgi:hypothetical protein